ncbi:ribonuclease HIII [Mycoplasmoides alvi]|uniref:ribonuclease HIII n=1 Tax=Mycoplasmoides alvi TaxID=78580 RepID=UPI0006973357|nr:ribonuclease HIII [Mycoplasmoides alvi]
MKNKNITKKLNKLELKKLIEKYNTFLIKTNDPNIHFSFILNQTRINVYKTGTIVFQGKNADETFNLIFKKNWNIKLEQNKIKKNINNEIGSDEVGVGDYFGGISVCAVFVNKEDKFVLKNINVQDSKKLNNLQIQQMAQKIINANIKNFIAHVDANEYNNLFNKYQNSHVIKTFLHNKAINGLIQKYNINRENTIVIMDQFASKKNYENYLNKIEEKLKIKIDIFETQGESKYLSIATASILARNFWLESIKKLEKKINSKIYLGSSNPKVLNLSKFIYEKYGFDELKKFVKLHFSFTKKIIK